ncbi:MFS general substrate transporter [Glonium stellatum]|uniref:MFS general substrate transporter n=1 Tax=Glonium stellatum TaxID=574774 RepID=A0A8E2JPX0_9PEZI|nr:MFS general substrate transporter [Glonium stellatum]
MATLPNEKPFDEEKPNFIENTDESPKKTLQKELTLTEIDVENRRAYKGDDSDGKVIWSIQSVLAAAFLSALYTDRNSLSRSQVILYFTGGSLSFIAKDLGITHGSAWLPTANILAIAATAPYAGYFRDLFGKRYIALFGTLCTCIGCLVLGTTHTFGQALVGMSLAGMGAAIGELTSLAGLAEVVPVRYRGHSLAAVTAFVLPFTPYLTCVGLYCEHSTWRWGPWIALIYNAVTALGLLFTCFPHNHTRAEGFSHRVILKKIGYVGGLFSIVGLTLFLVALQPGGYTHSWKSAYVLCTLLIGTILMIAWRIIALAYIIAFAAGMNFFSLLNFFPVTFSTIYDADPVQIGLKGLSPALSTTFGAILFNSMLSAFRAYSREMLLIALVIMTAFGGSLAVCTPENPKLTVVLGSAPTLVLGTLAAFGVGGVLVPAATVAMIVTPDILITTATALSLSQYVLLEKKLPTLVAKYAIQAGLPLGSAKAFVGTSQWAYSESLKYVWFTSIAFGSMAIVCCVFLLSTKKYQTNRVSVQI